MKVQVNARNKSYQVEASDGEAILRAGLRCAVDLPYECGTGTCGTCKARLLGGELHDAWPQAPGKKYLKQPGEFLMCQCSASSDAVIEVANFVHATGAGACVPQAFKGRLQGFSMLTHDVAQLDIDLDRPMPFDAGQYALVSMPGIEGARGWSMVNFGIAPRRLRFVIKRKPGGGLSERLFGGGPVDGVEVDVFGPLGHATFHPDNGKNLLCIAGGSGIAGMMSILSRAVQDGYFQRFDGDLFFGVRTLRDAFFLDELATFVGEAGERLKVTVALSDEDVPAGASAHAAIRFDRGFVHEVAKRSMQGRFANLRAFIAGPPPAVDSSIRFLLLEARVPADQIKYDKFS